jgi:hypothetical protein
VSDAESHIEPEEGEEVDGLPVVAEARPIEQAQPALVPARQAAALAVTGFVAGAATVAVVTRRRAKVNGRKRRKRKAGGGPLGEIVGTNSFLVDVHLLRRN